MHKWANRVRVWLDFASEAHLLGLEAAVIEVQGAAVLGDYPHDLFRRAVWHVGFDFEGQLDVRPKQSRKMSNHFISDLTRVSPTRVGSNFTDPW